MRVAGAVGRGRGGRAHAGTWHGGSGSGSFWAPCSHLARGVGPFEPMPHVVRPSRGQWQEVVHNLRSGACVWAGGVDRLPPWTRTHIRPSRPGPAGPAAGRSGRAGRSRWTGWPPRTWTGSPTRSWPSGSWCCGGWLDRLDGQWLKELAGRRRPRRRRGRSTASRSGSTAGWLRQPAAAERPGRPASAVRTARALFRGPLTETAQALCRRGDLGRPCPGARRRHPRPARPRHRRGRTGPGRGGPPAGPASAAAAARPPAPGRRPRRRRPRPANDAMAAAGCGWPRPSRAWSPCDGLLEPEAGQTLLAALEPLARPADAARHPQR